MTGDVMLFRRQIADVEATVAYYVLLSLEPEMAHAAPVVRTQQIERIVAGLRQAMRGFDPESEGDPRLNRIAHSQALALKDADRQSRAVRVEHGGW